MINCSFAKTIFMLRFLSFLGCIFSILTFLSFQLPSEKVKRFYIALDGNDQNTGTIEFPFAGFEAAKKAVKLEKQKESDVPIEVIVRGGVYYLNQTIEFSPEDSGTKSAPVIWKSADGEKVILSGGKRFSGKWIKNDKGIWYTNVPEAKGWKREVHVPEKYAKIPPNQWNFRELFVNGNRAIRARYPNKNESNPFLYASSTLSSPLKVSVEKVNKSWGEAEDAQINIVPRWRFFNQWNDVVGVDLVNNHIDLGPRELHGEINKDSWFWIEGVKDELDMPGEWFLDHQEGKLYYKPLKGENPNKSKIIAPYLNRIFYLKGDIEKKSHVSNIYFQGFHFSHTTYTLGQIEPRVHTDAAVVMENTQNCQLTNCHFNNIGGYALWFHLDSKNNVFDHNTVKNAGGGGVLLTGARLSYMDDTKIYSQGENASKVFPILNRITRNIVEHCGQIRYYGGGVHIDSRPASMAMEPGNYIAHNHFKDLSRNGIFAFRNQGGNVVEFNEINDCMQKTIDGAAIHFATMNRLSAPNYIVNNYLYDIWGYEQLPTGIPRRTLANGVFLDWATSNTTVKNNVIYNSGDKEIKPIMGNWNLHIDNNLSSKTKIEPFLPNEIGPLGSATHCIYPEQLINIGGVITSSDSKSLHFTGNWEVKKIQGLRNLFKYNCFEAAPDAPAEVVYDLPVPESGFYKLCLMYFPDVKSATNAKIFVRHAKGVEKLEWNFRIGDPLGFSMRVGEFYFEKSKPATISISNENADGFIIADAVGLIKQN
jgi:hypothetical protein